MQIHLHVHVCRAPPMTVDAWSMAGMLYGYLSIIIYNPYFTGSLALRFQETFPRNIYKHYTL